VAGGGGEARTGHSPCRFLAVLVDLAARRCQRRTTRLGIRQPERTYRGSGQVGAPPEISPAGQCVGDVGATAVTSPAGIWNGRSCAG
jgi:hypothetical protein